MIAPICGAFLFILEVLAMEIMEKYHSWISCPSMNEELLSELKSMNNEQINDSFYKNLDFGTGGLRGVLGAGTNRMNLFSVLKATRGLGAYLKEGFSNPSCAVSFDSRIHSRDFAELTAATLASMGIIVWIYPCLQPTPMLSFAVRHLHTSAGVMITASHNPAKFNGYKVYGPDGRGSYRFHPQLSALSPKWPDLLDPGRND